MKSSEFALKDVGPKLAGTLQLFMPRNRNKQLKEILKPLSPNVIWTSTAHKNPDGTYTSEWAEWCASNMPGWLSKEGILYKVKPGAKVLSINTDKDALNVGKYYGHVPVKKIFGMATPDWIIKFPWDKIAEDFDGVHHEPRGDRLSNWLMSYWDVESTVWFNEGRGLISLDWATIKTSRQS